MSQFFKNNMPQYVDTGVQDNSVVQLSPDPITVPIHLPIFYLDTVTGRNKQEIVTMNDAKRLFGADSFNPRHPCFTHQTKLAVETMKRQPVMIKRLEPFIAEGEGGIDPEKTSLTAALHLVAKVTVVPDQPVPMRNMDTTSPLFGQFIYDDGHVDLEYYPDSAPVAYEFGAATENRTFPVVRDMLTIEWFFTSEEPGSRVNTPGDSDTTYYHVGTIASDSYGSYGNLKGFSLETVLGTTREDKDIIRHQRSLLFAARQLLRPAPGRTPNVVPTLRQEPEVIFAIKPGVYNYKTDANYSQSSLITAYEDDGVETRTAPTYCQFGDFSFDVATYMELAQHILDYEKNARDNSILFSLADAPDTITVGGDTYVKGANAGFVETAYKFMAGAAPATVETWSEVDDLDLGEDDIWMIDPFSGRTLHGMAPLTYTVEEGAEIIAENIPDVMGGNSVVSPLSVGFTMRKSHFLVGGNDAPRAGEWVIGDRDIYDVRVSDEVELYSDIEGRSLLDERKCPFSAIYDSGFDMDAKRSLLDWLGKRGDVHVTIGMHIHGQELTLSERLDMANSLLTYATSVAPESEYHGTSACRFAFYMQSCNLINDNWPHRVGSVFEIAGQRSAMLGAGNGRVNLAANYTIAPLNEARYTKGHDYTYLNPTTRQNAWDAGLNYIQSKDHLTNFFAAQQTGYALKNSLLTSELFMQLVVNVKKQLATAWTITTGRMGVTDAEFLTTCEETITDLVKDVYGDLITVIPRAYQLPSDVANGYSYRLDAEIYGDIMKTVQVQTVSIYRNTTSVEG